jgi:NADPH2:quinone reductase
VLRPKGKVVIYGTCRGEHSELLLPVEFRAAAVLPGLSARHATARARGGGITHALEAGKLHNRVGPTFPLAEAAAAHEAVERGTIGNVIVTVG